MSAADPRRMSAWSGILYFMARSLERWCGEVELLGPVTPPADVVYRAVGRARRVLGLPYVPWAHRARRARSFGRIFEDRLRDGYDVIFAPAAAIEIAELSAGIPVVYSSDTTYALLAGSYPGYAPPTPARFEEGNALEQSAISRAAALVYPSEWAARSALDDYGASPDAVHVFPYGANLTAPPSAERVRTEPQPGGCRLLFIGRDWERKGGEMAVAVLDALRDRGVDATLTVVGCDPPVRHPAVRSVGLLRKDHPTEGARLERLLAASDFLLLPTTAECFGIVFCEASAYGLPSIAPRSGGVGGAVVDGENGFLIEQAADPDAYAEVIARLMADPGELSSLRASSRRRFEAELNWDVWGRRMAEVLGELV